LSTYTRRVRIAGHLVQPFLGFSEAIESTCKRRPNQRSEKLEPSISRALLSPAMSQDRQKKSTIPIQSNIGGIPKWIAPSMEASPKVNHDTVERTRATISLELRKELAQYLPDGSRPTHSRISEPVETERNPEAPAKVILTTSLDEHVHLTRF
jgi:hypothetical protein